MPGERVAHVTLGLDLHMDGGESLQTAAEVFAHHLKDSPVWSTFELCPSGQAWPCQLMVRSVREVEPEEPVDFGAGDPHEGEHG